MSNIAFYTQAALYL